MPEHAAKAVHILRDLGLPSFVRAAGRSSTTRSRMPTGNGPQDASSYCDGWGTLTSQSTFGFAPT